MLCDRLGLSASYVLASIGCKHTNYCLLQMRKLTHTDIKEQGCETGKEENWDLYLTGLILVPMLFTTVVTPHSDEGTENSKRKARSSGI